mmetsp:Transcript_20685/g.41370  ORF Transcript_20685/g.41370 Transcript_20685/m.41370 type:complete len:83 (-) Transcript_20685:376-624(-)
MMSEADETASPDVSQSMATAQRAFQFWLDKSTIHILPRWAAFLCLLILFFLRIYLIQGFFYRSLWARNFSFEQFHRILISER